MQTDVAMSATRPDDHDIRTGNDVPNRRCYTSPQRFTRVRQVFAASVSTASWTATTGHEPHPGGDSQAWAALLAARVGRRVDAVAAGSVVVGAGRLDVVGRRPVERGGRSANRRFLRQYVSASGLTGASATRAV